MRILVVVLLLLCLAAAHGNTEISRRPETYYPQESTP